MTSLDHLFIFIITIVFPVVSFISYRKLLARIANGEKVERSEMYNSTIVSHWSLFAIALVLWGFSDRSWADLGFGLHIDSWFLVAIALTLTAIAALYLQHRQVTSGGQDIIDRYRERLGTLDIFLPRNGNELGRFYGLSLTAGIVEEVLWRGFLIWYLSQFMPVWAAAVVSSIGFGVAHSYQGARNLPLITLAGAVFALLFILSGSLWLPMILHAAVDMFQGRLAYEIVSHTDASPADPGDDSAAVSA